jgi:hypothetical protein
MFGNADIREVSQLVDTNGAIKLTDEEELTGLSSLTFRNRASYI